jgi:hypothetical protein
VKQKLRETVTKQQVAEAVEGMLSGRWTAPGKEPTNIFEYSPRMLIFTLGFLVGRVQDEKARQTVMRDSMERALGVLDSGYEFAADFPFTMEKLRLLREEVIGILEDAENAPYLAQVMPIAHEAGAMVNPQVGASASLVQ